MVTVLVPVRYPLSDHSRSTLRTALDVAEERGAELVVLHVDLYHEGADVTRSKLKAEVEREFGQLSNARHSVVRGFLVEETILEEVAAEAADVVVIGQKQIGRWRRVFDRLIDDPDIADYLKHHVDCEVLVAQPV